MIKLSMHSAVGYNSQWQEMDLDYYCSSARIYNNGDDAFGFLVSVCWRYDKFIKNNPFLILIQLL